MTDQEREMMATVTQILFEVITCGRESIDLDQLMKLREIASELDGQF